MSPSICCTWTVETSSFRPTAASRATGAAFTVTPCRSIYRSRSLCPLCRGFCPNGRPHSAREMHPNAGSITPNRSGRYCARSIKGIPPATRSDDTPRCRCPSAGHSVMAMPECEENLEAPGTAPIIGRESGVHGQRPIHSRAPSTSTRVGRRECIPETTIKMEHRSHLSIGVLTFCRSSLRSDSGSPLSKRSR